MHYCAYSFDDLFTAANGRAMTDDERQYFAKISQQQRNIEVDKLSAKAGWRTELVSTAEGSFTAFWPG